MPSGACARTRRSSPWCATKLTQRAASYRFALERLVIMTPSPQAVDVERTINQLQAQIARYRAPGADLGARAKPGAAR